MYKYASSDIGELAHQLTLAPARLRLGQLAGIENLLGMVKPEGSYPYELVCYHITGYKPRGKQPRPAISGRRLIPDLVVMAEHISRKGNIPVEALTERYVLQEELGRKLSVSTKTIRRWRSRGLMGVRAVFADGTNRQVFLERSVKRFCEQHAALVRRGAAFKQLSAAEKQAIVTQARELLSVQRMKLHVIARQVAAEMNRAVETVRYTLRRYDEAHPDEALFANGGQPRVSERHLAIWKCHQAGDAVDRIALACGCEPATVEQILREMEVRELKEQRITCVYSDEFAAPHADRLILGPEPVVEKPRKTTRAPKDLPAYLRSLYDIPLLTAEQERDLFRRYNYLKYRAGALLESIDECEVTVEELATVRRLLVETDKLKNRIIQANLRLVVSIAKRHVSGRAPKFFEVVSDGNLSLIRAVENFDYARGNKFSTYASWAIMKNYARTIPEDHYRYARYVTGQEELLEAAPDHRAAPVNDEQTEDVREALAAGLEVLTEKERTIVTEHYGLFGRGAALTLEQLGNRFGVTKERIRQIEKRALTKLQETLSPAVLDLIAD
ncbi:MAG TPA: sigma-70 family RNA polymerase sigma factor [Phycisphaerae bacterium]|nr:sigma-70 family RNA polymerase sigma factor [Phycisphaerae bacterium]